MRMSHLGARIHLCIPEYFNFRARVNIYVPEYLNVLLEEQVGIGTSHSGARVNKHVLEYPNVTVVRTSQGSSTYGDIPLGSQNQQARTIISQLRSQCQEVRTRIFQLQSQNQHVRTRISQHDNHSYLLPHPLFEPTLCSLYTLSTRVDLLSMLPCVDWQSGDPHFPLLLTHIPYILRP
jgi:hypothetical protein